MAVHTADRGALVEEMCLILVPSLVGVDLVVRLASLVEVYREVHGVREAGAHLSCLVEACREVLGDPVVGRMATPIPVVGGLVFRPVAPRGLCRIGGVPGVEDGAVEAIHHTALPPPSHLLNPHQVNFFSRQHRVSSRILFLINEFLLWHGN